VLTGWVVTGNVTLVAPLRTVTLAGMVMIEGEPFVRVMTESPCAEPVSNTVPVDGFPPPTVGGLNVTEDMITGGCRTVTESTCVTPPNVALMLTVTLETT
jgi:hypothetical protein